MCRQLYQHEIEGLQAGKDQLEREVRELQTETQMNEQEVERGLHNSKAWSVVSSWSKSVCRGVDFFCVGERWSCFTIFRLTSPLRISVVNRILQYFTRHLHIAAVILDCVPVA